MDIKEKRRLLIGLTMVLAIELSACKPIYETISTDFFVYEINLREKHATVRRLTDLGKEQEILVIPPIIENVPVKYVGEPPKLPLLGESLGALLLSDTVKKVYLPFSLDNRAWLTLTPEREIILNAAHPSNELIESINRFSEAQLYYLNDSTKLNTFFMFNYELAVNDGYYWMDYINGSNPYYIPSDPIRESYIFSGWYYEEEGTTLWDNQVPASENEFLILYAKWI